MSYTADNTQNPPQLGKQRLWDNSNIAESYSGLTLPLTASFARHIYSVVYQEVALTSGIPRQTIEDHKHLFDNMLGFFRGRFYYNMYNWYRLLLFFPAFRFTKTSMEQMMSAKSADFQEPPTMSLGFQARYLIRAIYRFFRFKSEVATFKNNFDSVFRTIAKKDLENLSAEESVDLYYQVESKLLRTWHTPIDNDFLLMVFYGLLRKLTNKFGLDQKRPGIYNDLLSNIRGIISAEQTDSLLKIAQEIRDDQASLQIFSEENSRVIWSNIKNNQLDPHLAAHINHYLNTFGRRFANELKLEEPNLQETPEKFIELLKVYVSTPKLDANIQNHTLVREQAEKFLKTNLGFFKRALVFWVLGNAEGFLKNREQMRLNRSDMFGFVRDVFRSIGNNLAKQKIIHQANDIFYLEINEIIRFIEGSSVQSNLASLVELRRKEFELYKNSEIENRFMTHGIPYLDLQTSKATSDLGHNPTTIKGMPCSSGKTQGQVQVMNEFSYNIRSGVKILVAKHTDPGWTPIFSRFSGIIVENGGQLSHAAIVSRELGIPCIVGVKNITQILESGDEVSMDGSTGELIIKKQK